jgi:hypothetical protein
MEKTSAEQAKSTSPPFGGEARVFCYDGGKYYNLTTNILSFRFLL